ncbi:MAG TPA: hypothetical protein PLQ32_07160 [Flavihumibacter sp.]|nr:hypothetical protein [Flavihumibacter sp.]
MYSAITETRHIFNYYDKNLYNLVFFPNIVNADIDYQSYCRLLSDIKKEGTSILSKSDLSIIADQLKAIPDVTTDAFKIHGSLPIWSLYVILPLGIVYWIGYYLKITSLLDKLRVIESTLQSVAFSIKVNID